MKRLRRWWGGEQGDFRCPVITTPVEYVVVKGHHGYDILGGIPRSCIESLGIDVSVVDHNREHPGSRRATWFNQEQSKQIHAHQHWVDGEVLMAGESG
jgi:hypothetical protein